MSGSPEKRRNCIAQLPLRSTSGGSKFASEHLGWGNSARDRTLFVHRHYRVFQALDIGVFRTKRLRRLCKSTRLCWPRATFPTLAGGFLFASFYGNCGTKFPKIDRERDNQSLSYSDVITGDLLETRKWCQITSAGDPNDTHAESFDCFHRLRFFRLVVFLGIR